MTLFKLQGFHDIIRKDRTDGQGGGVAVYVRENIAYKRLFNFEVAGVEAVWLSIQTIEGKISVCCYRPPNRADFRDEFDVMINNIKQANVAFYMFILGDLNADLKTCNGNKPTQLCYEHNLQYLVNEPTRITTSQTILDQILTNAPILC